MAQGKELNYDEENVFFHKRMGEVRGLYPQRSAYVEERTHHSIKGKEMAKVKLIVTVLFERSITHGWVVIYWENSHYCTKGCEGIGLILALFCNGLMEGRVYA